MLIPTGSVGTGDRPPAQSVLASNIQVGHLARGEVAHLVNTLAKTAGPLADAAHHGLLVFVLVVEVSDERLGGEHQAGDAGGV